MNSQTKYIEIVLYNPDWPQQFEAEAQIIKKALGENCMAIHHMGSTAVPELAAKPVIDMICVLKDPQKAIIPLELIGFQYKGEYNIPMRHYFNKKEGINVNLHAYENGHPEIDLNLLFRDYLRDHSDAREEYASLKESLLKESSSCIKKNNSPFSGYTLGKDAFIAKILKQAGFSRLRFLKCTHDREWEAARQFRQKYFFDKVPVRDPYIWTFNHPNHIHFILYLGAVIIGYAHIQLWPDKRAALRIIVIDEAYRHRRFGSQFLELCEKHLRIQGCPSIHTESSPEALPFYKKLGYICMPFNDPEEHESSIQDTPMGKTLG